MENLQDQSLKRCLYLIFAYLLTMKPEIYVANLEESDLAKPGTMCILSSRTSSGESKVYANLRYALISTKLLTQIWRQFSSLQVTSYAHLAIKQTSLPTGDDERPNGIRQMKVQRFHTRVIDAVAAHDKSKLSKVIELTRPLIPKEEKRDTLLETDTAQGIRVSRCMEQPVLEVNGESCLDGFSDETPEIPYGFR